MANGSRRSSPTLFSAAAVPSEATLEARNTPCAQSKASVTSGTALARRPPNRMAEIGTPVGSSHSGAIDRALVGRGGEAGVGVGGGLAGARASSRGPSSRSGAPAASSVRPSHQTSPSSVSATLVKMQLACSVAMAFVLVCTPVPGATPKKPASGLIA